MITSFFKILINKFLASCSLSPVGIIVFASFKSTSILSFNLQTPFSLNKLTSILYNALAYLVDSGLNNNKSSSICRLFLFLAHLLF